MRLKRVVAAVLFVLSAPAVFAGVTYHFSSNSTGIGAQRISGVVKAEGQRMRVDIAQGDGATFRDHSFVLADGNKVSICDPDTKTFYDLSLDPLASLHSSLGDAVSISNEQSTFRDLGQGHNVTQTSYDIVVAIGDMREKMHAVVTTESWTTDKYPESASIGKVLSPSPKGPKGFPLKQVTTFHIDQNGILIDVVSTTTVSDIVTKPIPATDLAMPAGYRKVESPIEKAMKSLGR